MKTSLPPKRRQRNRAHLAELRRAMRARGLRIIDGGPSKIPRRRLQLLRGGRTRPLVPTDSETTGFESEASTKLCPFTAPALRSLATFISNQHSLKLVPSTALAVGRAS